jgi:hypothetical protein
MASINNRILRMDISYPGIGIKLELSMLREYIGLMEGSLERIGNEYIQREEAKNSANDPSEYQYIYLIAEEEIPRIIRNPTFVSIYSLLESAIYQLMEYGERKEKKTLHLRDIGRGSLFVRANKYMQNILSYEFQFSNQQLEVLSDFSKMRNFIVHSYASVDGMTHDVDKFLMKLDKKFIGSAYMGQISVTGDFLNHVLEFTDQSLRSLMSYMEDRYFGSDT